MYLVLDLETGSNEFKGRKGSPWANKILAIGLKYQAHTHSCIEWDEMVIEPKSVEYEACLCDKQTYAQDYMPKGWLDGVKILIGHNIKFDLLHVWRNDELQVFLRSGGRIWDSQLAEYILSGQRDKYAALRVLAVNRYGCQERTKKIEEGLQAGIMTQDMDIEDLLFDVKNDVLDTEAIFMQQIKIAKERGMYNLIMLEMDSLLATTEMEFNGMYVNKEVMEKNKQELLIEYEQKRKELDLLVGEHWK